MQLDRSNKAPSEVVSRYLEAIYYMNAEGETVRSARLRRRASQRLIYLHVTLRVVNNWAIS